MAEYVVRVEPVRTPAGIAEFLRVGAVNDRLGRTKDRRSMDAAFSLLTAARSRHSLGRVHKHVCRHDEGVGDCSAAVVEG